MYQAHVSLNLELIVKGIEKETIEAAWEEVLRKLSEEVIEVNGVDIRQVNGESVDCEIGSHEVEIHEVEEI
ncbi:hypothetical protein PQ478_08850 [Alkalihalophilus pseudofirmus]|uniref:hypothetical protein n=1 Tax=Alkalihalophilus pseudofirmus TaxID=79885 RepID=UPI00259BD380|nr:hypothetical protein [Alkalihalophilus pseudofirmus]WEG18578.1 hypothetical protein PQ478_08850 [Alkalihalophilus pseudofirmus]